MLCPHSLRGAGCAFGDQCTKEHPDPAWVGHFVKENQEKRVLSICPRGIECTTAGCPHLHGQCLPTRPPPLEAPSGTTPSRPAAGKPPGKPPGKPSRGPLRHRDDDTTPDIPPSIWGISTDVRNSLSRLHRLRRSFAEIGAVTGSVDFKAKAEQITKQMAASRQIIEAEVANLTAFAESFAEVSLRAHGATEAPQAPRASAGARMPAPQPIMQTQPITQTLPKNVLDNLINMVSAVGAEE